MIVAPRLWASLRGSLKATGKVQIQTHIFLIAIYLNNPEMFYMKLNARVGVFFASSVSLLFLSEFKNNKIDNPAVFLHTWT